MATEPRKKGVGGLRSLLLAGVSALVLFGCNPEELVQVVNKGLKGTEGVEGASKSIKVKDDGTEEFLHYTFHGGHWVYDYCREAESSGGICSKPSDAPDSVAP
jgi:hypothetical protein